MKFVVDFHEKAHCQGQLGSKINFAAGLMEFCQATLDERDPHKRRTGISATQKAVIC